MRRILAVSLLIVLPMGKCDQDKINLEKRLRMIDDARVPVSAVLEALWCSSEKDAEAQEILAKVAKTRTDINRLQHVLWDAYQVHLTTQDDGDFRAALGDLIGAVKNLLALIESVTDKEIIKEEHKPFLAGLTAIAETQISRAKVMEFDTIESVYEPPEFDGQAWMQGVLASCPPL